VSIVANLPITEVERLMCVQMQAKRVGRGLENPSQVRIIG